MNERIPPPTPPASSEAPLPRTAPPPFVSPASAPPPLPPLTTRLHPLAFIGIMGGALLLALALLLLPEQPSEDLSEAEVQALVRDASPSTPPSSSTRWVAPTRPSTLRLVTEPVGATVLLDGVTVGQTPLQLGDLRPDFYTVTLQLPDHAPLDTAIYLASSSTFALEVELQSLSPVEDEALALAERTPPSTDAMPVEPVTTSPRPAPSSPAVDQVEQRGTSAGGGAAATRNAPTPEPSRPSFASATPEDIQRVSHTGSLSISSTPTGAEVLVDGVPHGRAPLSLSGLRPGFYVVTVTLPGRTPVSYRAEVTARDVSIVKAVFPAE